MKVHTYYMTNLDSILKSRDITLPTKVCLVKAMVFPVVRYGCDSWTVNRQMSRQLSRGSAGEYQADEQAGVAGISWRVSGR